MLFRSIGLETAVYITHKAPSIFLDALGHVLREAHELYIIPYVAFSKLILTILLTRICTLKKCEVALIVHNIRGLLLYGAQQKFLWRTLIIFRSGLLKYHILYSYMYLGIQNYQQLNLDEEYDRYFVIYPFKHVKLVRFTNINECVKRRITIFAKLSKMINEEFGIL